MKQDKPPIHRAWIVLLALPALVAIWGGWVGLGELAGFGPVHLLPGIWDAAVVNLAVTLPAGMELYAALSMAVWLGKGTASRRTRMFAMFSSLIALTIGSTGQIAYHVLERPDNGAPLLITIFVSCLPVGVLALGAALFHLVGEDQRELNTELGNDSNDSAEPNEASELNDQMPQETITEVIATDDTSLLENAGPPPWSALNKSEAIRRAHGLLPGRSHREIQDALAAVGVDAPMSSVRRTRSLEQRNDRNLIHA